MGQSIQLADSLFKQGKEYDNKGKMAESEFYYREAYNLYRQFQDTASWLKAGKEYASAMVYRSKNEQAMELYKKLLEVDHPANDTYNRGDLYTSMGWSSNRMGKTNQAQKYYAKALPLAQESDDSLLIGTVYNNLASVHSRRGNHSNALKNYQQALNYYTNKRFRAIALSNIGGVYAELSLYDKALEYYHRSLNIRQEIDSVHLLANIYNRIGAAQRNLANYDQALVSYKQALDNSRQASTPQLTATILNNLGVLYKKLSEYDKAIDYYEQSLTMKKEISGPLDIATTTNNIGQLYWEKGNKKVAADYYRKALKLREQVGNPYDIATSLSTMLRLTVDQEDYKQATTFASRLKAMGDSTDSYDMLEKATTYLGRIDRAKGRDQEALNHFKKAYSYSQYLPGRRQLTPLKDLSQQYHQVGSDSSIIYGQKAINIIEENRANAGALSDFKSGYFVKHSDFYTEVASWVLIYTSDVARAYKLVEQAKARALIDELAKAYQNIDEQLPEKVRLERNQKRKQIEQLYSQLESAINTQKREELRKKIRDAQLAYASYENELRNKHPQLKSLQSPKPISLRQAQNSVDEQTVILEYALAGNKLLAFLISQSKVRIETLSRPGNSEELATQLTTMVTDFKDAILSNAPRTRLRSESAALYEFLLKPFENDLDNYSNLTIVPDGALAYLPFEAISQGDQYLIENYNIKYIPSLTSLTLLKDPESLNRKDLLAVAGSNFIGNNERTLQRSNLSNLPSTLIEVDSIATHFQNASILKNEQVSEEELKNLLRQNNYQYVHLATHGIIDENQPNRSGLALSTKSKISASSTEDGMLRSSEIFGMNINSDMVVLSACNTGLGKMVDGEGMLGMQRSFFYAGTSTVVVSLWNVYDRSTASFMNEFYKSLLQQDTSRGWIDSALRWIGWDQSIPFGGKAKAMREAKLKMIKHPLFNHPVYWAPFIVVGR
ncbi:CHAT domain-containing protein [Fodinibius sp.]|uniref:CHAT domain-containing protein n=1 Tax=Fodinibius sp. TaxID=1872440 RepID=UPI002ACECF93|nr:CHAT domain-containing protein [Fodinibius sp.]MDZ7659080.1 CHAT domain-containing protein [Fodinibius sp.]